MATLQEAIEAAHKWGWRVTKDGEEYVWCRADNRLEKRCGPHQLVYVSEDNLSGWTIEEPAPRSESEAPLSVANARCPECGGHVFVPLRGWQKDCEEATEKNPLVFCKDMGHWTGLLSECGSAKPEPAQHFEPCVLPEPPSNSCGREPVPEQVTIGLKRLTADGKSASDPSTASPHWTQVSYPLGSRVVVPGDGAFVSTGYTTADSGGINAGGTDGPRLAMFECYGELVRLPVPGRIASHREVKRVPFQPALLTEDLRKEIKKLPDSMLLDSDRWPTLGDWRRSMGTEPETYQAEIDWRGDMGHVSEWEDPRVILPYRWPLYDLETTNGFLGYIFDGLENLPDDQLPQQPRVWVLKAAYCPGYYVKQWLADAPLPANKQMYELRRAKAVRLRRERP